jgi:hypothetical protein
LNSPLTAGRIASPTGYAHARAGIADAGASRLIATLQFAGLEQIVDNFELTPAR